MTTATKPCPVRGCGAVIRAGSVFCSEDWARLPEDVARPIFYPQADQSGAECSREALAYLNRLGPLPERTLEAMH